MKRLSELKPRTVFAMIAGFLYLVFAASWLSDVATLTPDSTVPVEVTSSQTYKTFFRDVVGHVSDKPGMPIERTQLFYHNPLVNLRTILAVEGAESGFNPSKEKVLDARVNWRSLILYTGLWFLALAGFYWFMGEGPFKIRGLKLPTDPRHPSWIVIKSVVAGVFLTAILAFSASSFDSTEVVSIGTFLLAALGIDSVHLNRLKKLNAETEPEGLSQAEVRPMRRVG